MAANSSSGVSPAWMASRMCFTGGSSCVRETLLRGFDELDQNPAGVLGVDEVDPAVGRASLRGVVEETHATLAQRRRDGVDVTDPVRELLDALTVAVEELRDRGVVAEWRKKLDA